MLQQLRESTMCTAQTLHVSFVSETPLLAPSAPTFLDLIRVYRHLGGRTSYGMCVNVLTAAQK